VAGGGSGDSKRASAGPKTGKGNSSEGAMADALRRAGLDKN